MYYIYIYDIYICMYVCMCVYIYIYIHIHTDIQYILSHLNYSIMQDSARLVIKY